MNHTTTEQLLANELQNIKERFAKTNQGFSSGFRDLDQDLMGGFKAGNLYCFGSVAGMGKTMVALNILVNQLKKMADNEVLVFVSTANSKPVIIQKLLALALGIELRKIQNGELTAAEFEMMQTHPFVELLKKNNLLLIEKNKPTFLDINEAINALVKDGKIPKMLFIDCLQDIQVMDENINKEQAIYNLLKSIKVMAAQNQVPVLITSKVSRRVFYRSDSQVPKLDDLLHSRLIAVLCENVFMILRPNYYQVAGEIDNETWTEELHLYGRKNKHLPLNVLMFGTDIRKYQIKDAPILTPIIEN